MNEDSRRTERLAELVMHLTECPAHDAVAAVDGVSDGEPQSMDEALDVVARALVRVRRTIDLRDEAAPLDLRDGANEDAGVNEAQTR